MALSSRFLLTLLSFGLLPPAVHAQMGQGAAGSVGVSGPSLTLPSTSFGNQGVRQAPGTSPTGIAPTATDPRATSPRTGTTAEKQTSGRRRALSGPSDTAALPEWEDEFRRPVYQFGLGAAALKVLKN